MESCLKRVFDYKLLFDVLADRNGLVKLQTLESLWPSDLSASPMLPRGCIELWRQFSTSDGYLDWEKFSGGLEKALQADSYRLSKGDTKPPSEAEQRLQALRSEVTPLPTVKAEDIEAFLATCKADSLVQALVRIKKEAYRSQTSLHALTSPATTANSRKNGTLRVGKTPTDRKTSSASKTKTSARRTSFSLGKEKEELVKGLEVLESTCQWFSKRIEQVALEEKQLLSKYGYSEEMKAEELLAALEQGDEQGETIHHIQEINCHLRALAMEAAGMESGESMQPPSRRAGEFSKMVGRHTAESSAQNTPMRVATSAVVPVSSSQRAPHHDQVARSQSFSTLVPSAVVEFPHHVQHAYSTSHNPHRKTSLVKTSSTTFDRPQQPAPVEQPKPRRRPRGRRSQSLTEGIPMEHLYPQPSQQLPLRGTAFTGSVGELQQHYPPASGSSRMANPPHRTMSMKNFPTYSRSASSPAQPHHYVSGYPGHKYAQPPDTMSASYPPPQKQAVQRAWQPPSEAKHVHSSGYEDRKKRNKLSKMVRDQSEQIRRPESNRAAVLARKMPQHTTTVYFPDDNSICSEVL